MTIQQISTFVENKAGCLAEVTALLAENNIDLRALSLADTPEFGILRIIVSETDRAYDVLKKAGYVANITPVLAVEIADRPGGMASVLSVFARNNISLEYTYAFITRQADNACLILKVKEDEAAEALLEKEGVRSLSEQELNTL